MSALPTFSSQQPDWDAVRRDLAGLNIIESRGQRKQLSRDFYWYSPILSAQLDSCIAELVVKVSTEDDVRQVTATAAKHKLPLTVRGGGTGNYGQCVPLEGGLVMDVTGMCRVLDLAEGRIRVQAGARMHDIDLAARETGQALRMWPSTWHVATIGGFSSVLLQKYAEGLDPRGLRYLSNIRQETERMTRIVEDVLYLANIDRSRVTCTEVDEVFPAESLAVAVRVWTPSGRPAVFQE